MSLSNIDNDRVHLANECTYLAWVRTDISLMGFGVVIAKLRYIFAGAALAPPTRGIVHASDIGLIFVTVGLFTVALSAWRYCVAHGQIRQQAYRSSMIVPMILSTIVIVGLPIIWYLVESA